MAEIKHQPRETNLQIHALKNKSLRAFGTDASALAGKQQNI